MGPSYNIWSFVGVAGLLVALTQAVPHAPHHGANLHRRADPDRLVFCHFMIGIVGGRSGSSDYDADMQRANAAGIDAFALNIGTNDYTTDQLDYAYESAQNNGMKVFISFDFNWFNPTTDAAKIGDLVKQYAEKGAQLKVGDKVFVSSFAGDQLDVDTVRSSAGTDLFLAPNFQPANVDKIDGALNWMAWPSDGNNKAPTGSNNVTVADGDQAYLGALRGKPYIAPVSPWFSTHFGPEVKYSKNWVFPSDLLWYQRWTDILNLGPQYVEIITWNDYGESHYVGPLSSPHADDGASKWANDMPHDGWLEMAKPFISAYKAGSKSVTIDKDQIIYWYRPNPKTIDCDATDTTMGPGDNSSGNYFNGKPNGADTVADSIFVVSLLQEAGTVHVTSGDNQQSFEALAGAHAFAADMGVGRQSFSLVRGSQTILSGTSLKDVTNTCICGIYNFNAFVGSLPAGAPDPLPDSGLTSLTVGLHVSTCEPKPSLATTAEVTAKSAPTGTPSPTTIVVTAARPNSAGSTEASSPVTVTVAPIAVAGSDPSAVTTTTPIPNSPKTSTASSTSTSTPIPVVEYTPPETAATVPASPPQTPSNGGSGGRTITASSQIAPTNCLQPGDVWKVPPPADTPDNCDVSR